MKKKRLHRKKVVNKSPVSLLPDRIRRVIDKNSPSYMAVLHSLSDLDCEQLSPGERAYLHKMHLIIGDCMRYAWHEVVVRKTRIQLSQVKLPKQLTEEERDIALAAIAAAVTIGERQLEIGQGTKESTRL